MCCKTAPLLPATTCFWMKKIPICTACHELATSTWNRVERELARQRQTLEEWMELQVVSGKLLVTEDPSAADPA